MFVSQPVEMGYVSAEIINSAYSVCKAPWPIGGARTIYPLYPLLSTVHFESRAN